MSTNKNKKVIVAMSGGVDSSVVAVLLKEYGYQVEGVFMRLGIAGDNESEKSARAVAEKIGIKFLVVDLSREFKKKIIDYFISEYKKGRTPNPCVECNRSIKFGVMIEKTLAIGADYVATGHYARLQREITNSKSQIPKFKLLKADDKNKDQSYFLYTLSQKKLKYCLFPLETYAKKEVKKMAEHYCLPVLERGESQEICFIQSKYYGDFLKKYLKLNSGNIMNKKGDVLGRHKGLPLYTIGQRRDIGIGGTGPYYVIGINKRKNQLVVSNNKNDRNLFSKELVAKKVNWISGKIPELPIKIKAKTRYRMNECSAVVDKIKGKYIIKFSKSQRAIMPGQSVVFYQKDEIIGGGIIKKIVF